ncbi:MAG: oligosaccharide flippase family protein [Oscillospiraceae bacterium]|nr:oligosaccharide flippase family protein [Oscillospiraceae bacterium]
MEQAAVLTAANLAVRALGFALRIWYARAMGAEAMGVLELATSAHMLWIAPVTSGLPMAVSRLVAQRRDAGDARGSLRVLASARRLALRACAWLFPPLLLASPWIAQLLGDARTLPALWAYLPCLPILGLSAVYNGYCYGMGNTLPPALSELAEQALRFAFSAALLYGLHNVTTAWRAAFPALATLAGEGLGLLLVLWMLRVPGDAPDAHISRTLFRLALPMTLMRLCNTAMRTLSAILIPLRLQTSGLTAAEATARLGMFHGMAMPLMMMPSICTGALAMVAAPAIAANQRKPAALRRLFARMFGAALALSLASTAAICLAAAPAARYLYRQPDLLPLLRGLSPMAAIFGMQQVAGAMLAGLGLQRKGLTASLAGAAVTLALTWVLTAMPGLRLMGSGWAMIAGQGCTLLLTLLALAPAVSGHR